MGTGMWIRTRLDFFFVMGVTGNVHTMILKFVSMTCFTILLICNLMKVFSVQAQMRSYDKKDLQH